MSIDAEIGRVVRLLVVGTGPEGIWLARDARSAPARILLCARDVPPSVAVGDEIEVFVYLDAQGRPIATTRLPRVALGEVAFLTVTGRTALGALVDWGLAEALLVPKPEQIWDMEIGQRYPVGVVIDAAGRLSGTMRVAEMLHGVGSFTPGAWVKGEAWRNEEGIGLFVIVERRFVALLPAREPHRLAEGDAAELRVAKVLADGKAELSLRARAHEEIDSDAERVLAVLSRARAPKVGDRSSPEEIRLRFGLSKKAFKRALGRLLKQGDVVIAQDGYAAPPKR